MVKWIKCAALSAALSLGLAASAHASLTTFNFSDETGVNARGKLVLENYVPSTGPFEQSGGTFVSWKFYLGSDLVQDVTPDNLVEFSSNLDIVILGSLEQNHVVRIATATTFAGLTTTRVFETGLPNSDPNSAFPLLWSFRICDDSGIPCGGGDGPQIDNNPQGTYTWQMVPEPMTWVLMIGGFGAVGAQLRARRRRVA
jgi:hypothetical protein